MQALDCNEIIQATQGKLLSGYTETVISNISTDSRKIHEGDLFIPLIGEKFDGHEYIAGSLIAGAAAALTQKDIAPVDGKTLIKVENTLKALGDIARYYRQKFNIPVVGITGSVGKTSTKDMVAAVLLKQFMTLKTEGNFNNEIGLPMTVLKLDGTHEAAIVEMGMRGLGEISYLTSIAKPNIAIITNVGLSHIERLGSKENILKAKLEILEGLAKDGLVVLNGDDPLLSGLRNSLGHRAVFFGIESDVEYRAKHIKTAGEQGTTFKILINKKEYEVYIPVPGVHHVYNALAAIAAGNELGMPVNKMIEGISEYSSGNMRLNIINTQGIKVINDTYNANPQSMEAAIKVLKDIEGERKIAVLGDMLEMGEWAQEAHFNVGKFAVSKEIDYIITVGCNGRNIAEGARKTGASVRNAISFEENADVIHFLKEFIKPGDVILVKGSRGMKMEEIVNQLTTDR